jgi:diguanylate cyclase (GGDEF)-like protein
VDWATEALEAEIGVILEGATVLASVGFPRGQVPISCLADVLAADGGQIDIEGVGSCRLAWTRLEVDSPIDLVVARAGVDPFSRDEIGLLRAAARSLTLTLRLLRALAGERAARDHLQKRQELLERLSSIQREITRRVPLGDVLNQITASARDLLDVEMATLRLVDSSAPDIMRLVASDGVPAEIAAGMERSSVGVGVSGRAIAEGTLVIAGPEEILLARPLLAAENVVRAMAAPVRDGERVVGTILVATTRADHVFGAPEQEVLTAFAEHASLALTDAKRVEHIQRLAFHDELTGLVNRSLFMERLEQALLRAHRRRSHVAVLYLDLDRFKTINDSLGHTAGDQLLVIVGDRLRQCLRGEDTASRLGGDEFAILAHCDRSGAIEIAHRVLAAMEPAFSLDGREVFAAASIGICTDRGGRSNAERMLRDADTAMYRAKVGSGNGFAVFEPSMHAAALARIDLEADLRGAALRDEMRLDYQPIVDLNRGTVAGFEALVRWQHGARGIISPLDFIPLAEETGQIAELGRWILQTACAQGRRWQQRGPEYRDLAMSVNVSPRQLQDARFVDDVAAALASSGLDAHDLVLEITEGAVMVDIESAISRLLALRALGVSLAVDDFGTGHSSLGLLRRLPVDILKVDKIFVDDIASDPVAAALLETIVQMGGILSLDVVVEGIETASQAAVIAGFAGVLGQGYHLGRPMTAAAADALLSGRDTDGLESLAG